MERAKPNQAQSGPVRDKTHNNKDGLHGAAASGGVDSSSAWIRLGLALMLSTIGSIGMWSVVVALPAVQAEFGVSRAAASLPYTLTMVGFGVGGIVLGRWSDRSGIVPPVRITNH